MKKKNLLIGAAIAGLSIATVSPTTTYAGGDKGQCHGANSCKAKSDCKSASNPNCAGHNECKGKGYKMMSKSKCKAKGGTFKKS